MRFNQFDPAASRLKFEGVLADVYHRKFKDKIFEYIVMPESAKVLAVTKTKKILLLKETVFATNTSYFSLPGGRVEKHENPLQAAGREMLEETGYSSESVNPWFSHNYSQVIISTKHFFIAKNCEQTAAAQPEPTEHIQVLELTLDEFLEHASRDTFKHMELQNKLLKMLLDKQKQAEFAARLGL